MQSENGLQKPGKRKPLISIIVPVLNMEQTISRTLESIVAQRHDHVEIIVVDGQSGDQTIDKIQPYADHVLALISEPDAGLYDAINKGLKHATGEIIGILNGDDYYKDSAVLSTYADKFSDEEVGVVFGDLEFFPPGNPSKTIRSYSSRNFSREKLRYGWMPPHPTTFIRRSVYDLIGNYRTDFKISSDFEFLLRALWLNSLKFDRVDSVVVRMQYGGLSTKGLVATYTLNKEIIRACRENGLNTNWLMILSKFPAKLMEFSSAFRSSGERAKHVKVRDAVDSTPNLG